MKQKYVASITFAITALAVGMSASLAQAADPPGVAEHLSIATKAAQSDLLGPLGLCKTATPEPAPAFIDNYKAKVRAAA